MRTLGIDYGSKRVGVSMSDETMSFAMPLVTLPNDDRLIKEIKEIVTKNSVNTIVIGDTKKMNGKDNKITEKLDDFIKKIKENLNNIDIVQEPEFLTSHEASRLQFELGGKKEKVDETASAIILQSYLDRVKMSKQ